MTDRILMKAVLMLPMTGVLAGAGVYAAMLVAGHVEGRSGEVGAALAVVAVIGCAALLARAWWPLASGPIVLVAVASTVGMSVLTTAATITVAAEPYAALACADSTGDDFCGLGVLGFVPTYAAVVPWTLAGIPGLLIVVSAHRLARARRSSAQSPLA
ncbi:hypothetical protein [Nocardia sp. A7]|uniref:hypothetical protein n=1 Tax=Nocardia sp. A7 TaxID=2789274 RepID=UPI00397B2A98